MNDSFKQIIDFIKQLYPGQSPVPLHAPVFCGNEKKYLIDCIDSTYVSYVGKYVTTFEEMTAKYTGAKYAVAVANGTVALQIALKLAGVRNNDEVLTQPLTFVATANAIAHLNANPVFIDVDRDTLGMSPEKLNDWLSQNTLYDSITKRFQNKLTGRKLAAIVPMHTFGHSCRIDEIVSVAHKYNIPVIEDSAESLGSFYKKQHTGTFGLAGILSYNGNKTITTGGGGMIITDNAELAQKAKHITTTAKIPHPWEYVHDEVAYNFRLANVSAAIGVAQMEKIEVYLQSKRETADRYARFCDGSGVTFVAEPENAHSNYWLNAIILQDQESRDAFLEYSNASGIVTRPVWQLMNKLKMYSECAKGDLGNSEMLEARVVNIPSGVREII